MQEERAGSERQRIEAQIDGSREEISYLEAQIKVQEERIRIAEGLHASVERLRADGLIPEPEYKRRLEAHLQSKQNLSALGQQLAGRRVGLSQVISTLEQLPTVIAEKVQRLRGQIAELEQRSAEINGRRAYVLRAPVSGRVTSLQAAVGRIADPHQLQL